MSKAPPRSPAPFAREVVDLRALVSTAEAVHEHETVAAVFDRFAHHTQRFLAVLKGDGRVLGLAARRHLGFLLGARYGNALYARAPIGRHLQPNCVVVALGQPIGEVFAAAFGRGDGDFFDDVALVDAAGRFLGLINMRTLVRLQAQYLTNQADALEQQRRLLDDQKAQLEDDLRLAADLQLAMLPGPQAGSAAQMAPQFHYGYQPSGSIGGDFIHIRRFREGGAALFVADVMGHGVRSALVTAMLRALLEGPRPCAREPGQFLAELNRELLTMLRHKRRPLFVTAVYALFDGQTPGLRWARAGHPPPVWLRRAAPAAELLRSGDGGGGPALGLFGDAVFPDAHADLAPGDRLVFFTDGVIEAESPGGEEFSVERLLALLGPLADAPDALLQASVFQALQEWRGQPGFNDDVCLVTVTPVAPS